jgi:hypothetical protein
MFRSSTHLLTCCQLCSSLQHVKRRIASHVQVFNTSKGVLPAMFKSSTRQKMCCQPCSSLQHVKRHIASHVEVFNTSKDVLPAMFKFSTRQKTHCQPCWSLQHVNRRIASHVQVFNTLKDIKPARLKSSTHQKTSSQPCLSLQRVKSYTLYSQPYSRYLWWKQILNEYIDDIATHLSLLWYDLHLFSLGSGEGVIFCLGSGSYTTVSHSMKILQKMSLSIQWI